MTPSSGSLEVRGGAVEPHARGRQYPSGTTRDLFPFPLVAIFEKRSELYPARRDSIRRQQLHMVNDALKGLNWLAGFSDNHVGVADPMQQETLAQLERMCASRLDRRHVQFPETALREF